MKVVVVSPITLAPTNLLVSLPFPGRPHSSCEPNQMWQLWPDKVEVFNKCSFCWVGAAGKLKIASPILRQFLSWGFIMAWCFYHSSRSELVVKGYQIINFATLTAATEATQLFYVEWIRMQMWHHEKCKSNVSLNQSRIFQAVMKLHLNEWEAVCDFCLWE